LKQSSPTVVFWGRTRDLGAQRSFRKFGSSPVTCHQISPPVTRRIKSAHVNQTALHSPPVSRQGREGAGAQAAGAQCSGKPKRSALTFGMRDRQCNVLRQTVKSVVLPSRTCSIRALRAQRPFRQFAAPSDPLGRCNPTIRHQNQRITQSIMHHLPGGSVSYEEDEREDAFLSTHSISSVLGAQRRWTRGKAISKPFPLC
jgi:hypothetical protein